MKLLRLALKNFRSFKKVQELNLSKYSPGLYYVTGENKVEPSLGANASGKSSLFEALTWGLFGKISTNLKAGNVGTWGEKSCEVVLNFEGLKIHRTWNPNKLLLNDVSVDQDRLEKAINLNFDSFLYSVFISQFSAKFFDLAPAAKMSVFSSIMEDIVEVWNDRSDLAKKYVNKIELQLTTLQREISHVQGSTDALLGINYKKQIEEFETNKKKDIEYLETDLALFNDHIKDYLVDSMKIKARTDKLFIELDLVKSSWTELNNQVNSLEKSIAVTESELKNLEKEQMHMTSTTGLSTCPTCLQPVDSVLLADKIEETKKEIFDKLVRLNSYDRDLKILTNNLKKETALKDELESKIREEKSWLVSVTNSISNLEESIKSHKTNLEKRKKEINPYIAMEKDNKKKIKVLNRYKDYLQTEVNLLKEDYEIYSFWIKGFKDIRLVAIEDALKGFEVNINNELQKLGMPDWSVELGIEAETKSGTLKRGFTIAVKSPYNTESVPFESFSGGEGQRLRLAGTLGLIDFIHSTRGMDWDIEIYDEPSQFLSEEGIRDLVETLYYRAITLQKRIFFIDQRNMKTFGEFKGIVRVIKEKEGSLIYEEVA